MGLPDDEKPGERGVCPCDVCKLNTITRVADAVRDVPRRRKMLFYIGPSLPGLSTDFGCFAEVRQAREELLHAAGVANLAVHTVDSNLLQTPPRAKDAAPSSPVKSLAGLWPETDIPLAVTRGKHTGSRDVRFGVR